MNKIKENKPKIIGGHGKEGVEPVQMHGGDEEFEELEMDTLAVSWKYIHYFKKIFFIINLHSV